MTIPRPSDVVDLVQSRSINSRLARAGAQYYRARRLPAKFKLNFPRYYDQSGPVRIYRFPDPGSNPRPAGPKPMRGISACVNSTIKTTHNLCTY